MQQYDRGSLHSPSAHPRAGTTVRSPSQPPSFAAATDTKGSLIPSCNGLGTARPVSSACGFKRPVHQRAMPLERPSP